LQAEGTITNPFWQEFSQSEPGHEQSFISPRASFSGYLNGKRLTKVAIIYQNMSLL